jgi:trimethylamine:corrinoid methyltransferase-like protein
MKSATVLGLWWHSAVVMSAAFVVDAKIAENQALAVLTAALCGALMLYAAATGWREGVRSMG